MTILRNAAPFVLLSLALSAGIGLSAFFSFNGWLAWLSLLVGVFGLAAAYARRALVPGWWCALLALIGLGALRYQASDARPTTRSAAQMAGNTVLLEGRVEDDPAERPDVTQLRVRPLRILLLDDGRGTGASRAPDLLEQPDDVVLLRAPTGAQRWRYGDVIRAEGTLDLPPRIDAFDYRAFLAHQGVHVWMPRPQQINRIAYAPDSPFWRIVFAAKHALRMSIRRIVPAPESALLNGILIGDDDLLPASMQEAFRRTGTSHVISISGFNVGVIVGAVLLLVARFVHPRRVALVLIALLWLYALFVGGSASVVRAVVMATVALFGQLLWRRGFTLNTVCVSAFAMLLIRPVYLFDVGFQLSVAATLGLVLFGERFSRISEKLLRVDRMQDVARWRRVALALLDGALLTGAAQLTTLPLLIAHTRQLSLITLLSNALILPLQPPIMGLGIAAGCIGLLWYDAGPWVAFPVYALLRATTWTVTQTGALPWAVLQIGSIAAGSALLYYLALAGYVWVGGLADIQRAWLYGWAKQRAGRGVLVCCLAALSCAGVAEIANRPDGRLRIRLSGSSALVSTPNGARVLLLGRGDVLQLLGRPVQLRPAPIDALIVGSLDGETLTRGELVLRDHVAHALWLPTPAVLTDTVYQAWVQHATALGIPIYDTRADITADTAVMLRVERFGHNDLGNALNGLEISFGRIRMRLTPGRSATPVIAPSEDYELMFLAPENLIKKPENERKKRDDGYVVYAPGKPPPERAARVLSLNQQPLIAFIVEHERLLINH